MLVIESILEIIEDFKNNGTCEKELERAKNGYKSSFIYSLQNLDNLANQINNYNCQLSEPNSFIYDLERYECLTEEDINKAVAKYLTKFYIELLITPKKR